MKKAEYMTIRITKDIRDRLSAIAEQEHRSLSCQALDMLIKAIKDYENAKSN
jgi:predicted transcriptional regulator